jgi:hypothetical protein
VKKPSSNYVSFNTISLIYPLLDLMDHVKSMKLEEPNAVQANIIDNGYSSAIIVLAVTIFESAVMRVRFLRKQLDRKVSCADYFASQKIENRLRDHVEEMVAVRDALIHSHAYSTEVYWDQEGNLLTRRPFRLASRRGKKAFGNARRTRVIAKGQVTKKLKLNLVPTRVCRTDACQVLKTLDMALSALDSLMPGYLPIRTYSFLSDGWPKTFHEKVKAFDTMG